MKSIKLIKLCLLVLLIPLFMGGCGESTKTDINQVVVANQIDARNNNPIGDSTNTILSSASQIYSAVEVTHPQVGTSIKVEWRYITEDKVIASETFKGGRTKERPQEFVINTASSWLYSKINLTGLAWSLGSYEVTVRLNNQVVKKVGFNIVGDKEYNELTKKSVIKNWYLGAKINDQNQITVATDKFSRTEPNIYAVALVKDAPVGTQIKASWRYMDKDMVISEFTSPFKESGYVPFNISLQRFGRLWADGLWPAGTYEVALYVDNVAVATKHFSVS